MTGFRKANSQSKNILIVSVSYNFLCELATLFIEEAMELQSIRPLLAAAIQQDFDQVEHTLENERQAEMATDKAYWAPLRQELERLRRSRSTKPGG